MSKRSATEAFTAPQDGRPFAKVLPGSAKRENVAVDEMGEFEDAWEDELESDEEIVNGDNGAENAEDGLQM